MKIRLNCILFILLLSPPSFAISSDTRALSYFYDSFARAVPPPDRISEYLPLISNSPLPLDISLKIFGLLEYSRTYRPLNLYLLSQGTLELFDLIQKNYDSKKLKNIVLNYFSRGKYKSSMDQRILNSLDKLLTEVGLPLTQTEPDNQSFISDSELQELYPLANWYFTNKDRTKYSNQKVFNKMSRFLILLDKARGDLDTDETLRLLGSLINNKKYIDETIFTGIVKILLTHKSNPRAPKMIADLVGVPLLMHKSALSLLPSILNKNGIIPGSQVPATARKKYFRTAGEEFRTFNYSESYYWGYNGTGELRIPEGIIFFIFTNDLFNRPDARYSRMMAHGTNLKSFKENPVGFVEELLGRFYGKDELTLTKSSNFGDLVAIVVNPTDLNEAKSIIIESEPDLVSQLIPAKTLPHKLLLNLNKQRSCQSIF